MRLRQRQLTPARGPRSYGMVGSVTGWSDKVWASVVGLPVPMLHGLAWNSTRTSSACDVGAWCECGLHPLAVLGDDAVQSVAMLYCASPHRGCHGVQGGVATNRQAKRYRRLPRRARRPSRCAVRPWRDAG